MLGTKVLFLEDLHPGQCFRSLEREIAVDRTARFGPPDSNTHPLQIARITMRLLVESDFVLADGILGAGIEQLHWPMPAKPGDFIHVESEVLEVRRSKSRPDRGIVKMRTVTVNAAGEPVQVMTSTVYIRARTDAPR